jgi:Flp pilus assembly pilin Flp
MLKRGSTFEPDQFGDQARWFSGGNQMSALSFSVWRRVRDEDAVTVTEYAVLIALIVVVAIGAISGIGTAVMNAFLGLREGVEAAAPV